MILDITTKRNHSKGPLYGPGTFANPATAYSEILDTQGARGAELSIIVGQLLGEDPSDTITPVLQESDDTVGADFTNVALTDLVGGADPNSALPGPLDDYQHIRIGYLGTKRYLRVQLLVAGSGITSAQLCVIGALEFAYLVPGADPSPIVAS